MKLTQSIGRQLSALFTAAIAVAFISSAQAQPVQQGKATVRSVVGSAQYSSGGGAFQPLAVNTVLKGGDVVKTGPDSRVNLDLGANNGVVQVTPNSTLGIDKLTFQRTGGQREFDTQLDVQAGALIGKVNKFGSPSSKYEIKTPRGVAGIRGTKYRVTAAGEVTVAEGAVLVTYITPTGPQTFTVNAGQTMTPGASAPSPADPGVLREILDGTKEPRADGPSAVTFVAPVIEPFISPIVGSSEEGGGFTF